MVAAVTCLGISRWREREEECVAEAHGKSLAHEHEGLNAVATGQYLEPVEMSRIDAGNCAS